MALQAPLPKADLQRVERKVAYEQSKKEVSKWEPIVKKNREAPTLYLGEEVDLGYSTVGAIASEFEPRTEIEKKIASLVHDGQIMEAHRKDGSKLLELNKVFGPIVLAQAVSRVLLVFSSLLVVPHIHIP